MYPQAKQTGPWTLPDPASVSNSAVCTLSEFNRYIDEKMKGYRLSACGRTNYFQFSHSEVRLEHMAIDLVCLNSDNNFVIRKYDRDDIYVVQFPIRGHCEIRMDQKSMPLSPGQALVINPARLVQKRWQNSMLQVMLRISRPALERVLCKELETDLRTPLAFDETVLDGTIGYEFPRIIEAVWRDYYSDRLFQNRRIVRHLERTILLMLLGGTPHNYRSQFDYVALVAPYYVKRAEDFMHEHICMDITTLDLVAAAGVSERSLYYGFRRWRNTTPMSYLRRLRLDRARKDLQKAARKGRTITEVATNLGYTHLSSFSKHYKSRFGETPSETLMKGRVG
jgi:AraC-like DNA-binding protein